MRGIVARTQTETNDRTATFSRNEPSDNSPNTALPAMGPKLAVTDSASVRRPGKRQPPRNSVTAIAFIATSLMYSDIKNNANFIELYSVLYPPTSSCSASTRSNGARTTSAVEAPRKTMKPRNCGTMNHQPACCSTIRVVLKLSACITTPRIDRPSASSYESTWAVARMPPSIEYLLFEAQPAIAIPYTPTEVTASRYRMPTLIS